MTTRTGHRLRMWRLSVHRTARIKLKAFMSPSARLLVYLRRYRRQFLLGFACVLISTTISLLGPWVLKYAIDDLRGGVTMEKVRLYAAGLLSLSAVGGVFRFSMRRIIIGASRQFEYDLRNDFFA